MNMMEKAAGGRDFLVRLRRDLHQIPELGFHEFQTATRIARELTQLGWRVESGIGKTGIVGELGAGKPCIALRADMDGLPIVEENAVAWRSRHAGVMHACGHDAHMAILLGVASLISREKFDGRVRLLFQPSEETEDAEGRSGAWRMLSEGVLEEVDAILALHVDTQTPVGGLVVAPGEGTAGSDSFVIRLTGHGGHAAYPHRVVNPIYCAAQLITAIHSIVQRRCHPAEAAVVGVSAIHAGQADNVVPETVDMKGTIRYRDRKNRTVLHEELGKMKVLARSFDCTADLTIIEGYPPVLNDETLVELVKNVAYETLGPYCLHPKRFDMGSEDFSYFTEKVPGTMFGLGCRIEKDPRTAHHPRFDIDEGCLVIGTAMLTGAVLRMLADPSLIPERRSAESKVASDKT